MSAPQEPVTEAELQAYVDDRLDEARRDAVAAWLAERPEDARRVSAYREQSELLRRALGPASEAEEPPPEHLVAATRGKPSGRRWGRAVGFGVQAAAAIVLLVVGGAGGWWLRGATPDAAPRQMARLATDAHAIYSREARHAVEVGREEEAHLIGWLSKRLGQELVAPDFSSHGFTLVGGRLLPAGGGAPAAQFLYERSDGRRITCYVTVNREGGETAFKTLERDGIRAFYWIDGPLGYALVGEVERNELLRLAHLAYGQFRD